ncbi:MAG: PAC2 family protein [Acidimicrobiales bacterium]|nr:PAC2 family protein [Acidimicrobiales bacterium]
MDLTEPVLVAAFAGWNDAGDAATWAARHLRKRWAGTLVASIDGEEFTDFSTTRPVVTLEGTDRHIVWPRTEIHACGSPASPRDLLVLTATEPQLRWRTYCATVIELARHLGVQRIITLGALLGDVPHSRPVVVYGSSDDTELARLGLSRSSYEGPTGIVGVLNDACGHEDVPAASLWATVPGYVPGASSPKAALALVERLGEVLDVAVPLGTLPGAAQEYEQQLDSLVADDDETATYVAELERHYDDEHSADTHELPADADGLVAELERFLREQSD